MLTLEQARAILKDTKPKRSRHERYRQRDAFQHQFIPLLEAQDRDKFERCMNEHFRL